MVQQELRGEKGKYTLGFSVMNQGKDVTHTMILMNLYNIRSLLQLSKGL